MDLKQIIFRNHPELINSPTTDSPWAMVSVLLPNIFVLAGVILFILIVAAGFTVVTSSGNPERTQQGKQVATFAIIGFIIIIASYWIIEIVEIITNIDILNPAP